MYSEGVELFTGGHRLRCRQYSRTKNAIEKISIVAMNDAEQNAHHRVRRSSPAPATAGARRAPTLTASALSAATELPLRTAPCPSMPPRADTQPAHDADRPTEGGRQRAMTTSQNSRGQRQRRGCDQLPPQNGADRLAQDAAYRRSSRRAFAKPRDFSVSRQGRSTQLLQQFIEMIEAGVMQHHLAGALSFPARISTVVPRRSESFLLQPREVAVARACDDSRRAAQRLLHQRLGSRTDRPLRRDALRRPRSGARRRAASSARAWPISSAPSISISCTGRAQLEQPQQVGRRAARAADRVGGLLVRHLEFVDQALQRRPPPPSGSGPRAGCSRSATWRARLRRALRAPAPAPRPGPPSAPRASGARRRSARSDRGRPAAPAAAASGPASGSTRRARRAPAGPSSCAAGTCPGGCAPTGSVSSASRGAPRLAAEQRVQAAAQAFCFHAV